MKFKIFTAALALIVSVIVCASPGVNNDISKDKKSKTKPENSESWKNRVLDFNGIPTPKDVVQIYAHRGLRALLPENSLAGEIAVMRLGVDYIDMDILYTKDGVLIAAHDIYTRWYVAEKTKSKETALPRPEKRKIDPISGHKKYPEPWKGYLEHHQDNFLYKMTYKEIIEDYSIGRAAPDSIFIKHIFPKQAAFEYMPYAKADDVIDIALKYGGKKIGFNLELKDSPEEETKKFAPDAKEFAARIYKMIKEKKIIDQTEIQAFNWNILLELKKLDKNVKCAFLTEAGGNYETYDKAFAPYLAGHFLKDKCNDGEGHKSVPAMIKDLGSDCYEPYCLDLFRNPELIKQAHDLGMKVVPWMWAEGVSGEDSMLLYDSLVKNGVDGIIVDRSDMFRAYLVARDYNVPPGFYIPRGLVKGWGTGKAYRNFEEEIDIVDKWEVKVYE